MKLNKHDDSTAKLAKHKRESIKGIVYPKVLTVISHTGDMKVSKLSQNIFFVTYSFN